MIRKIKELFVKYREVITYIIFGALTTLVNYITYTIIINLSSVGITISNAIAWIVSVIFAFITNKLWVFESKSLKPIVVIKELFSFVASRALTGIMEIAGVPLLVKFGLDQKIFGIDGMVAKVIVSIIVVILNYIFSKLIIFKKSNKNN